MNPDTAILRVVLRRALANADLSTVPLHFEVVVLDRYLGAPGISIIRTNSVGRVKRDGAWSLDFGIAPDEQMVHVFSGDLLHLPDEDREHWAAHAVSLPASRMMLQMRLAPGSCFDDGEVRPWE